MPLCDSRPTEASGTRIPQSVSESGTQILIVCPSDPKGKPPGHRGFAARLGPERKGRPEPFSPGRPVVGSCLSPFLQYSRGHLAGRGCFLKTIAVASPGKLGFPTRPHLAASESTDGAVMRSPSHRAASRQSMALLAARDGACQLEVPLRSAPAVADVRGETSSRISRHWRRERRNG